jgi:uncharacterized protein (TIGR03435 family)
MMKTVGIGLLAVALMGPVAVAAQSPAAAPVRAMAFDVVSVRENKTPSGPRQPAEIGPTPDGYRSMNLPVLLPLLAAYVPSPGGAAAFSYNQVTGFPDWARQVSYDISAKVGSEDIAAWQKPELQPAMLQGMLQAMFTERFKLVVHREFKEQAVLLLVVAKSGAKLKETDAAKTPAGPQNPFGGVMVDDRSGMTLYGVSTGGVAALLSAVMGGGRNVVDKTGLTGKYDVHLRRRESLTQDEDMESVVRQELDEIGLKLEPGKAKVEALVIDHIEQPSAN